MKAIGLFVLGVVLIFLGGFAGWKVAAGYGKNKRDPWILKAIEELIVSRFIFPGLLIFAGLLCIFCALQILTPR